MSAFAHEDLDGGPFAPAVEVGGLLLVVNGPFYIDKKDGVEQPFFQAVLSRNAGCKMRNFAPTEKEK